MEGAGTEAVNTWPGFQFRRLRVIKVMPSRSNYRILDALRQKVPLQSETWEFLGIWSHTNCGSEHLGVLFKLEAHLSNLGVLRFVRLEFD